jgi:hypothetical protein
MKAQCSDDYLFHRWQLDGTCERCGVIGLVQGTLRDERWGVSQSESALLGPSHPVDPPFLSDFVDVPDPAAVRASSEAFRDMDMLDLPAFLRRMDSQTARPQVQVRQVRPVEPYHPEEE